MGVFEQFPYANMHEMNLEWLLKKMKELDAAMETFKATESLKFADPIIWDITTQYEKSTIVLNPSGNAYLSLQPVPTGIQLSNDEYWLEIFNFTDYTRAANQNLTVNYEANTTRATADYSVDDWLIWNDVLYKVTSDITIDDAFIVSPEAGYNIVHFTIEDFIKAFVTYATNLIIQYKNDIDASELAYRQQLAQDISTTTGALQAQLNAAIAGVTVDSEVINARVSYNGITYTTLRDAITAQVGNIHHLLDNEMDLVNSTSEGYLNRYNGTFNAYAGHYTSDYIPIVKGDVYKLTCSQDPNNTYDASFVLYNDDLSFNYASTSTMSDQDYTSTVTGYMRITGFGSVPKCIHKGINTNTILQNLQSQIITEGEIKEDLIDTSSIIGDYSNGYINKYDYSFNPSDEYICTDMIPVKAGHIYRITANKRSDFPYDCTLALYDSSENPVSYSAINFNDTAYTAPSDGFIRVISYQSYPVVTTEDINILRNIKRLDNYTDFLNITNGLKGKKVIWFGTSIPHGTTTEVFTNNITAQNNYPDMISKLFGCTVINQCVGTSTARTGEDSRVDENDPMGIKNLQWEIATLALTQTTAEKQSIIDDWDDVWGANGDPAYKLYQAPASLTQEQQTKILNSSYQHLLTPYLDGTYAMPDVFVLDHGYNDGSFYNSSTGYQMSEWPAQRTDKHNFLGAMNRLIVTILGYNPKAKIVLVSHYSEQSRPWVIDAQKVLAEKWQLPLIKVYEASGFSDQTINVGGVDKTMIEVYCPDGVHPHSDTTGSTNFKLASIIGRALNDIISN